MEAYHHNTTKQLLQDEDKRLWLFDRLSLYHSLREIDDGIVDGCKPGPDDGTNYRSVRFTRSIRTHLLDDPTHQL